MNSKKFSYWSTVFVMTVLILSAQAIVQLALQNEISARSFATNLARQRGRAYNIVFDAVQLQYGQQHKGLYLKELAESDKEWEDIQKWAYTIHVGPNIEAQIQTSKPQFERMSAAITHILLIETLPRPVSLDADVATLLANIDTYQAAFFDIFNMLSAEADNAVLDVRAIEAILCTFTLATMAFEYVFIIKPQRKLDRIPISLSIQ